MADCDSSIKKSFHFFDLPSELQQKVFNLLPYDEISKCRMICKTFDATCQKILNAGFNRVERFHAQSLYRVKSQLPRRESERRTHELSRHADILTSIETRLSLLSMTYGKYIDSALCCFIPGKVLDEMYRVLRVVNNTAKGDRLPRPHELLQELRDISSMAMEHFEEHIVSLLRDRISMTPRAASNPATASLSTSALVLYAAASGNPPLLSVAGLSTAPKSTTCRGHRGQTGAVCSADVHTTTTNSFVPQSQQFESIKRQWQAQRSELAVYKRELAQLRTTQQRQKEKMTEMERRLNEHEQRFTDILAQLRNGGLAGANHTGVGVEPNQPTSSNTSGAKRKNIVQNREGKSSVLIKLNSGVRSAKRRKLNEPEGGTQ